jgi:hypothetical protein
MLVEQPESQLLELSLREGAERRSTAGVGELDGELSERVLTKAP